MLFYRKVYKEYRILQDHSLDGLQHQVNMFLREQNGNGAYWEPCGGCTAIGVDDHVTCIGQAVVRVKFIRRLFAPG